uniref:Uncharacterized protein n=1 Tax=virus sp. ctReX5 TaxID=2825818 RepID=A0A8S5RLH2_9VIRU|nr:MAG TPA: hypothetical protein [virus sp. ctReX5]
MPFFKKIVIIAFISLQYKSNISFLQTHGS